MKLDKQTYEDICFGDNGDNYRIVDSGEWIDDGKCSYKDVIFEFEGKFYSVSYGRSGSYHTDYFYDWEYDDGPFACCEVEKKEVTTTKWVAVKGESK